MLGIGDSRSRAQQAFELARSRGQPLPAPTLVIDRLLAAMRDENARVRFDAVHALGFLAEAPLDEASASRALAAELDHYDPIMRAATARVLGTPCACAAPPSRSSPRSTTPASVVRMQAIEALGLIRDREALPALRERLASARGDLATAIVLAIARIGSVDDRDVPAAHGLADRSRGACGAPPPRAWAGSAIGSRASRLPASSARDRDESVRLAAAFALEKFGEGQAHVIAARSSARHGGAGTRLPARGRRPALPGLLAALAESRDARHRADLMHLVGWIGTAADLDSARALPHRSRRARIAGRGQRGDKARGNARRH